MKRLLSGRSPARLAAACAGSAVALAPALALACPVCFAAKDEANRIAFLGSTILLTSLPVLMISGLIYWVARRSLALDDDASEHAEREAFEAAPARQATRQAVEAGPAPEARQGELIPLRRGH